MDKLIIETDNIEPVYDFISDEEYNNVPYNRVSHFNEWLSQFQAKNTSNEIPIEVYNQILYELSGHSTVNSLTVKKVLKKLGVYNALRSSYPSSKSVERGTTNNV